MVTAIGRSIGPLPSGDLLDKYNIPGPRYTSYPTALLFSEEVDQDKLMADTLNSAGPLSLYFHLPFCQSRCWFCGCHKVITTKTELADVYLGYLEREISLYSDEVRSRDVVQIHFGGGTPNFLTPDQIDRLGAMIRSNFEVTEDAEIGIEIDPRTLSEDKAAAFKRFGMNRASIGIQDCDPMVQKAIHRIQTSKQNRDSVNWLRRMGVESLNVDLIYGLPYQSLESYEDTLREVLALEPDRFAIFSYAHVPWKEPAQKILEKYSLPSAEEKISLLQLIIKTLTESGYKYVGMDHFAKTDDPLVIAQNDGRLQRNFQGYSTHANVEILSFGISAISQNATSYRQNTRDINEYYELIDKGVLPLKKGYSLCQDDMIRRDVIMHIMCDMRLDFAEIDQRWGIRFESYFNKSLKSLYSFEKDNLVSVENRALKVNEKGRFFIRNIAMQFDAYLQNRQRNYSKTI